jgi:hypothetical protein
MASASSPPLVVSVLMLAACAGGTEASRFENSQWEGTFTTPDGSGTLKITLGTSQELDGFIVVPVTDGEVLHGGTTFAESTTYLGRLTCGVDGNSCGAFRGAFETRDVGGQTIQPSFIINEGTAGNTISDEALTGTASLKVASGTFTATRL